MCSQNELESVLNTNKNTFKAVSHLCLRNLEICFKLLEKNKTISAKYKNIYSEISLNSRSRYQVLHVSFLY
jgi:hypothetical protein